LVHDAIGRLLLSLDVRELVGERVHLGAQPLELLLDVGPLAADAFETLLVISELLVERLRPLRGERRHAKDVTQRRHAEASRKDVNESTVLRSEERRVGKERRGRWGR